METEEAANRPQATGQERRKRADLRPLFDKAVERVAPFFLPGAGLNGGPTEYWVAKAIQDLFPELDNQDVQILARAAANYFRERRQNE